jgi:hypothetical protein
MAMREARINREVESYIGLNPISSSARAAGPVAVAGPNFRCPFCGPHAHVPVALFTILAGLFLIVGRLKVLTQIVGYLS